MTGFGILWIGIGCLAIGLIGFMLYRVTNSWCKERRNERESRKEEAEE